MENNKLKLSIKNITEYFFHDTNNHKVVFKYKKTSFYIKVSTFSKLGRI